MRGDVKDILSIPNHLYKVDSRNKKDGKSKTKDGNKKNELVIKDSLKLTQGLFPMKTHRSLNIPKSRNETHRIRWKRQYINFKPGDKAKKPKILHWT